VNPQRGPRIGRLLNEDRFTSVPRGAEDVLRQGFIMLLMYTAYDLSRALVVGRESVAYANGMFFMNLEKALGMYVEPWIQARVSSVPVLMSAFVWLYQDFHLPIIVATLIFAFAKRRSSWPMVRNWFLAMNFTAVFVFALLPTMPPRMLFTSGIADMNYLYGARTHVLENGVLANPFAAMPSLHFGYALFVCIVIRMLARQRWLRIAALAYPVLIWFAVIATGNHFIFDTAGGALVALAAYVFATSLQPREVTEPSAVAVRERDG
jgi:membrane-associated phospholipid phosphatase